MSTLNAHFVLRRWLLKYGAIAYLNLQNQLAYIWDAANRAVFVIFVMFIFIQLWTAVYEGRPSGEIAGLTLANTIWYFLIAEVMELGRVRHDMAISDEVKDGSIAYTLIRPYNYLGYHLFNTLGELVIRMGLVFVLGLPVVFYYAGPPSLDWRHLPAVVLIIALAVLLDFAMASIIGLLAFSTEDTNSFRLIYQKLTFILGGLLIPIDFLPAWLQRIALALPFGLTTYAPARLFVAFAPDTFWALLWRQLGWLLIIGLVLWRQYNWAIRRLSINGG